MVCIFLLGKGRCYYNHIIYVAKSQYRVRAAVHGIDSLAELQALGHAKSQGRHCKSNA